MTNKTDNNHEDQELKVESPNNAEMPADEKQVEEQLDDNPKDEKEAEIERLQSELSEAKDKYLRLYSEFENFRRRSAKERLDLVQSANQELVRDLLPVLDDFERASQSLKEDTDAATIKEGMELISNKFRKSLEQKGVKPMENKPGMDFDPDIHEAITQIPAPKDELKGKVVDVIEKGYYLNDKVIRFAKVVIGS
ncbi:MAG: nucleotide exchange factor GrpE [Candidatus Cyclobacteriaceae bacterium M2_1C_046]